MADRSPPGKTATTSASEQRDRLIKDMLEKERAATDAKTAKLKALRLARDAELAAQPQPKPTPKRKR